MTAVRTALPSEVDTVASVLAAAFQDDPVNVWLFPSDERRTVANLAFFRVLTEAALEVGQVDVAPGAAALWFPGGPDEGELDVPGLTPAELDRLRAIFRLLNARTPPADPPHWHVQFIGVSPAQQGHGRGTQLMRHALTRYDAEGVPTYLESSSPRNAPLYRRLGYRDHGGAAFTLPNDGPPMRPMWRDPR
jgi:GNAT superfamily N-acetyltransferase